MKLPKYVKKYAKSYIVLFLIILCITALSLIPPAIIKELIDKVIPQKNSKYLLYLSIIFIVSDIVLNCLMLLQSYLYGILGNKICYDIRQDLLKKVQTIYLCDMQKRALGEYTSVIMNDVGLLRNVYTTAILDIISNSIKLIAIFIILFIIEWRLLIASMVCVPIIFVVSRLSNAKIRKNGVNQQNESAVIVSKLNEFIHNQKIIRTFGSEKFFLNKVNDHLHNFIKINLEGIKINSIVSQLNNIIITIGTLIIFFAGSELVIKDIITIGSLIAFYQYLGQMYNPIKSFGNINIKFQSIYGAKKRINELMEMKSYDDMKDNHKCKINGNIKLKVDSFKYDGNDKDILKNIFLDIRKGDFIAILGKSGIGKTTIVNILLMINELKDGYLLFDGVASEGINRKAFYNQVGVITQEDYFFNDTIKANITMGDMSVTEEEIVDASNKAGIYDFIMSLPDQYDTMVNEEGTNLSGGQKQRLSFSRIFIRKPSIIILDESTSALDYSTEYYICDNLRKYFSDVTCIMVTHRLSLLRSVDRILYLNDLSIDEYSNYDEFTKAFDLNRLNKDGELVNDNGG